MRSCVCWLVTLWCCCCLFVLTCYCKVEKSRYGSTGCSPSEAANVRAKWAKFRYGFSEQGHRSVFQKMLDEVKKRNQELAEEMGAILSSSSTFRLISKVDLYLHLLTRPILLRAQLLHDIRRNPSWALKALTLIPQVGGATDQVLTRIIDAPHNDWRRCISQLAKTVIHTTIDASLVAQCHLNQTTGDPSYPVEGLVEFRRKLLGGPTTVTVNIRGFRDAGALHGFHIHKFGELGDRCNAAGPHFNPTDKVHGGPADEERHIGDLGNVIVDHRGQVVITFRDRLLDLTGPNSIVGKSVVVHAGTDDLGRGGYPDSKTTGHAGGRIGCCVIEEL